jgi:hypothetical protein
MSGGDFVSSKASAKRVAGGTMFGPMMPAGRGLINWSCVQIGAGNYKNAHRAAVSRPDSLFRRSHLGRALSENRRSE